MSADITPTGAQPATGALDLSRGAETGASLAIAAIAFLIVTGETLPVGLLRDVADGLGATESQVGLTMSWYAGIAALTAVPMTRWARRFDRRKVLATCAVAFGAGHVAGALATALPLFLVGRGVAAVAHGLYFAVAVPAVIRIVRQEAKGRAGGRVAIGATSALVVGTPLSTLLGQATSWRVAMLAVAALAVVLALVGARVLPPLPAQHLDRPRSETGVLSIVRSRALGLLYVATVVIVSAHFVLWTYIEPYAAEQLGIRGTAFGVLLLVYGTAAVIGSTLGGKLVDWGPVTGARIASAAFVTAVVGTWFAAEADVVVLAVPLLLLWSCMFSVIAVTTGLAVIRRANGPRAETANAVHGIVFQLGIVSGSAMGAALHAAGHLAAIPLATAAGGVVVLALVLYGGRAFRRGEVG